MRSFLLLCCLLASVSAGEGVRHLPPGWLGANANLGRVSWSTPGLEAQLASLGLGALRYPGGTVGNYWAWRDGWVSFGAGAAIGNIAGMARSRPPRPANTPQRFAQAIATDPASGVWMLNMVTADLADQLAMLRAATAAGAQIRRVELGNELYFALPENRKAHPTAADYAREVGRWAAAIRAEFPGARCAALAHGTLEDANAPERKRTWDAGIAAGLQGIDALTVHIYAPSPVLELAVQLAGERGIALPDKALARRKHPEWPALCRAVRERPGLAAAAVATVRGRVAEVLGPGVAVLPPLPLWITEYNLFETGEDGLGGTWAQALALTAMTLDLACDPRVELALVHNLVGNPGFALCAPGADGRLRLSQMGQVVARLIPLLNRGGTIQRLPGDLPGVVVERDGRGRVLVLNPDEVPRPLPSGLSGLLSATVLRATALATTVEVQEGIQLDELPPLSLVIQEP